jgi:transposase InsO family protein
MPTTNHRDKLLVRIFINDKERRVVALPLCLRDYVLELYHDSFEAGHMGINNTFSRIAARYHWPGMRQDISNYVRSCETCLTRKGSVAKVQLPLNKIMAGHFNDILCVDMTHPGQHHGRDKSSIGTSRNTKAILTITDVWSHMTVLVAVAAENSTAYVTAFHNHWFKFFGTPRYILSDNGACFTSDFTNQYYNKHGILPIHITARNPQANGIAERVNRPITDAISMLIGTGDGWEHLMPYLQLMLNSRSHPVLGLSPLEAVMGHASLFADDHDSTEPRTHLQHVKHMRALREGIDKIYNGMKRTLQPRLLKHINIKRYSPGDLVRIFIKRSDTHKRAKRWSEPMTVIKCVSPDDRHPVNYLIKDKAGKESISHINKMKPHFERDPTNKGALKQRRSRKERKATSKAKSNDNESAHSMQTDQDVITTEAQSESTMQA